MREIKFRGREKESNKWVFGYARHWKCCYGDTWHIQGENDNVHIVIPETIGQYTGLWDCEGREIYEGDVIRSVMLPHMRTAVCNGCVVYKNGAFYVEYIDHTYANLGDLIFYSGTSSAVIGNVHDNPGLLEVEHDRRD